jgi:positive regulator of sigma E activity
MEMILIYMQALGILFGFSVINEYSTLSKAQLVKVILMSVLPTILYINLVYLGRL